MTVMATMGFPEFMSALGTGVIIAFAIGAIAWLGYCISSIARAADALERIVNCADYGDATSRRRFFLKAVRKGCGRIRWPEPTHAEHPHRRRDGRMLKPWRGVRECLDMNDLGTSIFNRERPLSQNTLRRIAVGMSKYNGMDFLMDMLGSDDGDDSRVHPLTNLGHRGNQNHGPKTPITIVRDAEGCILMIFPGAPYRTNAEAIAQASEFCTAMNEWHERAENDDRVCNAAAMREALEIAKKAICHHARTTHTCDSLAWENSTINANCGDILCGHRDLCEAKTAINAALSAPPRNCDRFGDEVDAQATFLNEVWLISVDRESMLERDKFENWTPEMKARYAEWLMEFRKEEKEGDVV